MHCGTSSPARHASRRRPRSAAHSRVTSVLSLGLTVTSPDARRLRPCLVSTCHCHWWDPRTPAPSLQLLVESRCCTWAWVPRPMPPWSWPRRYAHLSHVHTDMYQNRGNPACWPEEMLCRRRDTQHLVTAWPQDLCPILCHFTVCIGVGMPC